MKIRTILVISYLFLVIVPFAGFFGLFYKVSESTILNLAKQNISEMAEKSCALFDEQLSAIEDASQMLVVDPTLYAIFSGQGYTPGQLVENDRSVIRVLDQYFPQRGRGYAVSVITPEMVYGSPIYSSMGDFYGSEAYRTAARQEGTQFWIPTWTLPGELVDTDRVGGRLGDVYQFAAIRVIRPMKMVYSPVFEPIAEGLPSPVLLFTFNDDYIRQQFDSAVALEGVRYCIADGSGQLIAHSDPVSSTREEIPWLDRAATHRAEILSAEYQGREMVVSYRVSDVTGWVISFMVPYDSLMGSVSSMRWILQGFLVVLGVATLLLAYILSKRVSGPINELVLAVERAGEGDFRQQLQVARKDEIGRLTGHFNIMNHRLHRLVDENYKVRLREKETQIMVLTTQLNPHFLYNTLNMISMEALDSNAPGVSKMLITLSRMLQYTVVSEKETALFRDDLDWLQNYVEIMRLRHGERYRVEFDIAGELYDTSVPRLFLQPLLENAMLHGMRAVKGEGRIAVRGRLRGGLRIFAVEDNGCGIPAQKLEAIQRGEYGGVGLSNVEKRIQLIYGNAYGIQVRPGEPWGTAVTVTLPVSGPEPPQT